MEEEKQREGEWELEEQGEDKEEKEEQEEEVGGEEVIGLILAKVNRVQPKRPMDNYEGARIQFRPENKSCLTQ